MLGGLVGALFYWALIEAHHPNNTTTATKKDEESQQLLPEANINTPEQRASPTHDAEY